MSPSKLDYHKRRLNFDGCYANCSNKIWLFWNNCIDLYIMEHVVQFVHTKISSPLCSQKILLTVVYDATIAVTKISSPWILIGDFNCISKFSEQIGRKSFDPRSMEEFNECLMDCSLEDAG
ncbi:hypothetical protein LIER_19884 [Lithospermum erythrorhizon]|uniref:Uncharacterized protein n=1 Tax=Lithospermum erythrorhizon TaxID=34254 RepID=A0AAV3QM26_LITER